MTFKEAKNIILSGEPLDIIMMGMDKRWNEPYIIHPYICVSDINGATPCIRLCAEIYNESAQDYTDMIIYWTADGFLFGNPNTVV